MTAEVFRGFHKNILAHYAVVPLANLLQFFGYEFRMYIT
jgi:hypothetical protein